MEALGLTTLGWCLVAITVGWGGVHAYSVGAPDAACGDLTPQHRQTLQTSVAPYVLSPNATVVFGGERIVVKVEAQGDPFKGFFIQARPTEDGGPIGMFFTSDHNAFTCGRGFHNAVTHRSSDDKKLVTIEWEAPTDYEGDVLFRGTVVKSFTTYWNNLRSDKVTIRKRSVGTQSNLTSSTLLSSAAATTQASVAGLGPPVSKLYNGCGEKKSCFGSPPNCQSLKNCAFMVTYTLIGDGKYEFELHGTGGSDRFVAVGLSSDQFMGSDSVVLCASKSGSVDAYMTWNEGKTNVNILNPKEGIEVVETGDVDGALYCKFIREEVTKPNNREFNLKNERYHVMVAEGPISQDNHAQYHGKNRIISAGLVNLGETSHLQGGMDTQFYKMLHGCFMIGAWICAASCGIMFARYFKQTWRRYKSCNIDQWFHFHRLFMITTWCLTITALVLIWVALQRFQQSVHSLIGIVSIVLCFIQPFMAALRPHPNGKHRSIFNWLHWFVGNSAQILGITAIFFGFELYLGSERNWVKEVAWYILIIFIAFHCLIHLLLSISQCFSDRKPKSAEVFPLKELGNRTIYETEEEVLDAPHGCFRKFILGLYLPINWLITALLILLVVFEKETIEKQLTAWKIPAFWKEI